MNELVDLNVSSILKAKLYPPPVTPDLVPRADLLARLERNRQRPLTLISAPAGYGKSVLASMWLETSNQPGAWISLDESENDIFTFFTYLLAGIKTAVPDAPLQQSQTLLKSSTLPPIDTVTTYLMNDLAPITTPFSLVLDDIHVIQEPAVFELIATLLKHPSPNLHLVLIGRHDPPLSMGALRAYQKVTEIRPHDLRFSAQETAQFLHQMLGRAISDSVALEWTERTEGWVVALRLSAISLLNRGKTADLGVNIPGNNQYLQEYLLAEILAHLPAVSQAHLLKTALLDRFCAPLCEVVCGEAGETTKAEGFSGEAFIQWLRESNLFLIALDDNGEWFRFHHLFQDYLRNLIQGQLSPQEIASIHLRAGKWLADKDNIEDAIRYALRAGDTDVALSYFYQCRHQYMNNERWITLEQLIKLFPEGLVTLDPVLSISRSYIALEQGLVADIAIYLDAAKKRVAALPADSPMKTAVCGDIATLDGIVAFMQGQAEAMMANSARALETLPTHARHARGWAVGIQAASHQITGDWQIGFTLAQETISNPNASPIIQACILYYLCIVALMEGALPTMLSSASHSLQLSKEHRLWPKRGRRQYFLGIAYYLRNDLVNAEIHLAKTVQNPVPPPTYLTYAACALARLYQSQQRLAEADQLLQEVSTHLADIGETVMLETVKAFQVDLALDRNNVAEAQQLSLTVDFDLGLLGWFHYTPQLAPIRLLLCQGGQKNLEMAQKQLAVMEDQLRSLNRKSILIDVLALQAMVNDAQGDTKAAYEKVREAVYLAKPGGCIRNFVDLGPPMAELLIRLSREDKSKRGGNLAYIEQILAAFPQATLQQSNTAVKKKNKLTTRELEILNHLKTDNSPQDIAEEIVISPATVRTHIRNIYAKLEVNARFEAVHIAREQGLL